MTILIDGHQDIAYNMLTYGRNYLRPVAETRRIEAESETPNRNGHALLGWPEYQRGQVALIFSTIFVAPARYKGGNWETLYYRETEEAHRLYLQQVNLYRRMADEHPDAFRLVRTRKDLAETLEPWTKQPADPPAVTHPVGLMMSMEGVEGLARPEELESYWELGVRAVGPVWAGGRFCGGSNEPGGFTREGFALLDVMAGLGLSLDIAHMTEESALTALDSYPGPIICSHANAAALLDPDAVRRHLSDRVIRRMVERGGVMGVVLFNKFVLKGWTYTDGKAAVRLEHVLAHIDHICQVAGSAAHVAIGSDFDGGFGWQGVPAEIDTVADLQKLGAGLRERGYAEADIAAILGRNWQRHLENSLPA
jgi:membrane dipeptidase